MLITSNRSVTEWDTVFPVVATAILNRLLHHNHVLTLRGDSYRLRAERAASSNRLPATDLRSAPPPSGVTGETNLQPRT
jgi:hypothetical protein